MPRIEVAEQQSALPEGGAWGRQGSPVVAITADRIDVFVVRAGRFHVLTWRPGQHHLVPIGEVYATGPAAAVSWGPAGMRVAATGERAEGSGEHELLATTTKDDTAPGGWETAPVDLGPGVRVRPGVVSESTARFDIFTPVGGVALGQMIAHAWQDRSAEPPPVAPESDGTGPSVRRPEPEPFEPEPGVRPHWESEIHVLLLHEVAEGLAPVCVGPGWFTLYFVTATGAVGLVTRRNDGWHKPELLPPLPYDGTIGRNQLAVGTPAVVLTPGQPLARHHVFVRSDMKTIWTSSFDGSSWSAWDGPASDDWYEASPSALALGDGTLHAFSVHEGNGFLIHLGQYPYWNYHGYRPPPGRKLTGTPYAVSRDGQTIDLFAVCDDRTLWHRQRNAQGGWGPWDGAPLADEVQFL